MTFRLLRKVRDLFQPVTFRLLRKVRDLFQTMTFSLLRKSVTFGGHTGRSPVYVRDPYCSPDFNEFATELPWTAKLPTPRVSKVRAFIY